MSVISINRAREEKLCNEAFDALRNNSVYNFIGILSGLIDLKTISNEDGHEIISFWLARGKL